MKDTRKQREKDGPDVKTKSPHSIATPPTPSTSSSPPASNVLKITKKSHTIQKRPTSKSNNMQTKLVSVRNENGTKSVIVSKVKANATSTPIAKVPPSTAAVASAQSGETSSARVNKRPVKTADESKRVATQKAEVEPKRILNARPKATTSVGQKEKRPSVVTPEAQKSSPSNADHVSCKYCNLRFLTPVWLKKHVDRKHAKQALADAGPKSDASVKIRKYKEQLDNIQQTLDRKNAKQNPKRAKVSPKKQRLREQLKLQLAAQQKLLQVQQEIFEKTSKAQQDIFNLIAKLGDDDEDEDESMHDEESIEGDTEQISIGNVKFEGKSHPSELYLEDPSIGELIISDTPNETYEYYPAENYGGLDEQYVADEDGNITVVNADGTILRAGGDIEMPQNVTVLVRSDEGVEEFELVELDDQMCDDAGIGGAGIDFEVIGRDTNSMHCRIVSNENASVGEIEYVEVQTEQDEHQKALPPWGGDVLRKQPIKLEMGKLQQIAQKRCKKQQQQSISTTAKNIKSEKSVAEAIEAEAATAEGAITDEATGSESKVLNTTIHRSEKQTNEYITKVVQNAVPTDDNKFECPICMELVSNRYSLGPHILRLHSKQKSKICQYCDRSFTCTGDLTRHIRIHTGEKPFKCTHPNCQYAFRASGDLHKHMRRHNSTTVNIRQHVCTQCERAFERGYDLKRHELTHKKNEEGIGYTCEFCSKRFVRKDQHKAHVYRHLGIKQYKCPDCNRHFSDFSNCSKHIRQCQAGDVQPFGTEDEDVPQYICDICNKRFKSKMGMKQHIVKCTQITEMQRKLQESFKESDDEEN